MESLPGYDFWKLASPAEPRGETARCDACGEYVNEDELVAECDDGPAFCRGCVGTGPERWDRAALLAEQMRRGIKMTPAGLRTVRNLADKCAASLWPGKMAREQNAGLIFDAIVAATAEQQSKIDMLADALEAVFRDFRGKDSACRDNNSDACDDKDCWPCRARAALTLAGRRPS